MQHSLNIPGFEGQDIKVDRNSFFKAARIYVNGIQPPKGSKWFSYGLTQNDGTVVDARVVYNLVDPIPTVEIGGDKFHPTEPLSWGQCIWAGWPVLIMFLGGFLGVLFGMGAGRINGRIMRKEDMNSIVKYVLTGFISLVAVSIPIMIAIAGSQ